MRRSIALTIALLAGACAAPREVAVDLIAPRDANGDVAFPEDAPRVELRLARVEPETPCPTVDVAASGREPGELAHTQSFDVGEGMGRAIGEIPDGLWTLTAIARTQACEVRLFGCAQFETARLGDSVEVVLEEASSDERCGCRECAVGACSPEGRSCR